MSFLAKLWSSGRHQQQTQLRPASLERGKQNTERPRQQLLRPLAPARTLSHAESARDRVLDAQHHNKKCLQFGADPVRILLFRECETRVNRSLLFDSMAVEGCKLCSVEKLSVNGNSCCRAAKPFKDGCSNARRNSACDKRPEPAVCEHEKLLSDDTNVLCAMTFGSVSMTYKGPSFKIHVVNSPASVVCAKVFPFSEHSVCRPSQRHSSETLGTSTTFDSNSSNSSLRTQNSRPGSGNLSSNSLSPALRKNSTCSSVGSGWDIDVPRLGSSQSLDGSSASSPGIHGSGSLTSLRRRWQRAVSTSLVRSESDDAFGCDGSPADELQAGKHRSRLGLVLLIHLPAAREQEVTMLLLEHAPLLEGMLDRLRYSCNKGPRQNLVYRLYRALNSSTLRLLRRLARPDSETAKPLLWHNVLLHSAHSASDVSVSTVHRSLQQMCWLLEKYDTKSTNFFISTIVTAVLTHHLGWVHTAPPCRDKQTLEKMGKQYNCNPLWAQLADLYGALGTPTRIAHTVIAGEPEKVNLIESVLHFLTYFIRSGIVEKQQEARCPSQGDFLEARASLERALRRNPGLKKPPQPKCSSSEPGKRSFKSRTDGRRTKHLPSELACPENGTGSGLAKTGPATNGDSSLLRLEGLEPGLKQAPQPFDFDELAEASTKKLKRSNTMHNRLGEYAQQQLKPGPEESCDERQATSKVKIIVCDEDKRNKLCNFNKQPNTEQSDLLGLDLKLPLLDRQKLPAFDRHPANSKTLDEHLAFASNFGDDARPEVKSQVFFTLGDEKPNLSIHERLKSPYRCQCSYTFTCVPSTSAELPEGILRKIIQRNFPESSKNMQPPAGVDDDFGMCLRCRRGYGDSSRAFENGKLLETPTNATEVLRGCSTSGSSNTPDMPASSKILQKSDSSDSLEALLEANGIVELPMPRTKKDSTEAKKKPRERIGFSKSLIGLKVESATPEMFESGYTWGMVMQGLTKRKNKSQRESLKQTMPEQEKTREDEWWWPIRENLGFSVKFPVIDQPVAEALCIIGDLDSWQVGLLSNVSTGSMPISVGMSRLVSNMLEAFVCMWKTFHSPEICIKFLESRLREMWMRSRTLAEFLLTADLDDASVSKLTDFLDVDVADLPLLVAVASTHTPQISQRFGLTLA